MYIKRNLQKRPICRIDVRVCVTHHSCDTYILFMGYITMSLSIHQNESCYTHTYTHTYTRIHAHTHMAVCQGSGAIEIFM